MIDRAAAVSALRSGRFDVVVVGGGITGAGVALDAASRGYDVALVERSDFSAGTSSRSSKLIHGGLRYLQTFDLGLVREALLERQLLTTLAPHLVTPLPLVLPTFDGGRPNRLTGVGLNLYDVMALQTPLVRARRRVGGRWNPDRHRTIDAIEALELLPALARRPPTSGYLFYDCQTDDARLVLAVLGEAERFGAVCANRLEVIGLVEEVGRARGVTVADRETGERFVVAGDNVVNATGVWADRLRPDELHGEAEAPTIRPSRGAHITLSTDQVPLVAGAIVPAGEGRTIFALPWLGRTLIGTTDEDHVAPGGDLDHVAPAPDDLAYLLDAANAFFATELTTADITGAFAGVRPLIETGDTKKSVDISRKAELYETSSGMVTITGGKLTTYRRMAKMAVDRLAERDGMRAPCRTDAIALGQPVAAADLLAPHGVPATALEPLAARYGAGAHEVLAVAGSAAELSAPIVDGFPDLLAEIAFAARREQARSIADVLLRRTRLGLLAARDVVRADVLERVAATLGDELGWSVARRAEEIARFRAEAVAEGIAP